MCNPAKDTLGNSPLTARHIPRPRLDKILGKAGRCKLVYVIAGAGYGKTQAVYHYIKQQEDAVVRWVQLTESDNIGSRYWESLTHIVSSDNPELAVKLCELGFPETPARFKQFANILKRAEHHAHKTFLVLDDFHLIHSKQALTFAERCAHLQIPGACVIIISRKEPEINAVSLFSKGRACIITEVDLQYTQEEIADFFKQSDIPFSLSDLPKLFNATQGWALAVKLLSLVLKKTTQNLDRALEVMKQNIFKLLETEAFDDFPESVQKRLVQLSLISDLPLTPLNEILHDESLIQYAAQLTSFIWFDSFSSDHRVHPLYMEFLQNKQFMLAEDEKQDIYRRVAQWCFENNFYTDAVKYCAKARQFDRMLEALLSHPFRLPYDACEHYLNILEDVEPENSVEEEHSVLLLKHLFIPLLYMGMGRHDKAREWSMNAIKEWERSDAPIASYLLYTAYSNLAYIDTYTCTVTHNYDFSKYLQKAVEYYQLISITPVRVEGPFGVADIRSFACLVGEGAALSEFDQFLDTAREAALYIGQTYHNMYYGYDDLAACELAFFKNQLDMARNYAHNAVIRAREKKQHSIEMMAQYYLLRLAIHDGDYPLTEEILKQLDSHLRNPDFWNRQLLYDLFAGSFYAHIGVQDKVPSWIVLHEIETVSQIRIPVRELIVGVRYYFACRKYKQALAVLSNSYPRDPQDRFHFGELTLSLLLAFARLKTGDTAGAANAFIKAYEMSFDGVFEMPFIELGRALRPLAMIVSEREDTGISGEWLKAIERKATIYAKKTAVVANAYKRDRRIVEPVSLTEREQEVLTDLYHGLSREEIATNQYLSINTIKTILNSIFMKLDAGNNVDAIRIALEKKLIE